MAKRLKEANAPLADLHGQADDFLENIKAVQGIIDDLMTEYNDAVARLKADCEARLKPFKEDLARDEKALVGLMKAAKKALFTESDVVYLSNGMLLYTKKDKVSIPRDHDAVIAICEQQGFGEVVKIVKSLDREAIEKWPDERLFLIGAERKPKEEFNYDLKKEPAK
ncbi:MAG TPA: host-nuclease inhibitor Gam family protein [Syntrophales bacterium]|nr:host-nuclease inhibitor Gam family protein [Syntrophales bacterium]